MADPRPCSSVGAFAGAAEDYARYRAPYPHALVDDLTARAGITGEGRLLDLGCGPGRVALALSPLFQEVWAIDPEAEMISLGRELAQDRGITNIHWVVGTAEDLEAPEDAFELITMGEAFHRMDQGVVGNLALSWLRPGGCISTMGCLDFRDGEDGWQAIVSRIVEKWTADTSPPAASAQEDAPRQGKGPDHDREVMTSLGFEDAQSHFFEDSAVWTVESILGFLYSTSQCSRRVLGDNVESFEKEIAAALHGYDAQGEYADTIVCGYTISRLPG